MSLSNKMEPNYFQENNPRTRFYACRNLGHLATDLINIGRINDAVARTITANHHKLLKNDNQFNKAR